MAQQGLDPTFGLKGTCTSHVSGFGGWPLGVALGVDQRPVLVCSAPAQAPLASGQTVVGRRFREAAIDTPRVVSFPPDGRPVAKDPIRVFGPSPASSFTLARAAAEARGVAVLGAETRRGRPVVTLMVLRAQQPTGVPAVAQWSVSRKAQIADLRNVTADSCAVGWLLDHPVLVARDPAGRQPVDEPRLTIYDDGEQGIATMPIPVSRSDFDLPRGARPELRVGSVYGVGDGLFIGLSWVVRTGTNVLQGRASVLRLVRDGTGWAADPAFGAGGLWLASSAEGEVTSADLLALSPDGRLVVIGRGVQGGPAAVPVRARSCVGPSGREEPFRPGNALRAHRRFDRRKRARLRLRRHSLAGSAPNAPAEAVVLCLLPDGQPDPGFGTAGVASFRLNGGTYATAIQATDTGTLLVATALRWGSRSRSGKFHPCVTRLAADGGVDPTFGLAGVSRHDGVAEARLVAVAPTGRVWSAGVAKTWQAQTSRWQPTFSLSQLTTDGGLATGFGQGGVARPRLPFSEYAVRSLVPTAAGGAILSGPYIGRTGASMEAGTWIARVSSSGKPDDRFGTGGVRSFAARDLVIVAELSNGSLHGWEFLASRTAVLRLTASGNPAPGFGPTGSKPIKKGPLTFPHTCEPNGEWFAPVVGTFDFQTQSWSIGLIRGRPDGAIDTGFGAGVSSPGAERFVPTASIRNQTQLTSNLQWEPEEDDRHGRHQTLRLADGTYLTLLTLAWDVRQIVGMSVQSRALVLVAWTTQGKARPVQAWGNQRATVIPHPRRTHASVGWVFRTALLQSDGSVIVGLAGDDADQAAPQSRPPSIRSTPYFCRLLPGSFDLDPVFGGGHVERRLPGDDEQLSAAAQSRRLPVPGRSTGGWRDRSHRRGQLPDRNKTTAYRVSSTVRPTCSPTARSEWCASSESRSTGKRSHPQHT